MFDKLLKIAELINAYRIIPRLFISVYVFLLYKSVMWFMGLPAPSMEQAGLISVMTGVGAAWFQAYVNSGSNK